MGWLLEMIVRDFQPGDEEYIGRFCMEQWFEGTDYGNHYNHEMGIYFALTMLSTTEDIFVAELDGIPVGCIVIGYREPVINPQMYTAMNRLKNVLKTCPGGRKFIGDVEFFEAMHEFAYKGLDLPERELLMLMSDKNYRGKGVGRALMDHVAHVIDSPLYLYTDTDCDIGFYDRYNPRILKKIDFELRGSKGYSLALAIDLRES